MSSTPDVERAGQTAIEPSITGHGDDWDAVAATREDYEYNDISFQQVIDGLKAYEELLDTEFAACDASSKDCVRLVIETYRSRILSNSGEFIWQDISIFQGHSLRERGPNLSPRRISVLVSALWDGLRSGPFSALTAAILNLIAINAVSQMIPPGLIVMILQVVFESSADNLGLELPENQCTIFLATNSAILLAEEYESSEGRGMLCG